MAFAVHLNSYVLVILCALMWYGDRQLSAQHAEECQGDMLPIVAGRHMSPIVADRRGNFNNIIFTVMYEREGDHRLFLQSYAKISVLHRANQTVRRTGIVRISLPAKSQISKYISARYGVRYGTVLRLRSCRLISELF
jgi:hypothetical protein